MSRNYTTRTSIINKHGLEYIQGLWFVMTCGYPKPMICYIHSKDIYRMLFRNNTTCRLQRQIEIGNFAINYMPFKFNS